MAKANQNQNANEQNEEKANATPTTEKSTAVATSEAIQQKEVANIAIFDKTKVALSNSVLDAISSSGVFESEGIDITSEIAGDEFWQERQGTEVGLLFESIQEFESDFHDDTIDSASCVLMPEKKRVIVVSSMLVSELKKHGAGAYKITYLGKKKGKKFTYNNFKVVLLQTFAK